MTAAPDRDPSAVSMDWRCSMSMNLQWFVIHVDLPSLIVFSQFPTLLDLEEYVGPEVKNLSR
jgi:hypothetical protein